MVDEHEFLRLADALLARLEVALESLQEEGIDFDFELRPGGILELEFADGSKIVINRHLASREVWLAARTGGFHFRPPAAAGESWRDTKSGEPFDEVLARAIGAHAGRTVTLTV